MDQTTNLSSEFASRSAGQELFSAIEPETDRQAEFNVPEEGTWPEHAGSDLSEEIPARGEHADPNRKTARTLRRRNLLLQMAAAGLSMVVVTSAMGVDLLGSDVLFSGSSSVPQPPDSSGVVTPQPPVPPTPEDGWIRIYTSATQSDLYYSNGQYHYSTLGQYVGYDSYSNTLSFETEKADAPIDLYKIETYHMGDLTLFISDPKGEGVHIGQLLSHGSPNKADGSITIDGDEGSILSLNPDYVYETGLQICANGGFSRLMVNKQVTVDICGTRQAVLVENAPSTAIQWETPYVTCSGEVTRTAAGPYDPSTMPLYDWTVSDTSGIPACQVLFRRGKTPVLEGLDIPYDSPNNYNYLNVTLWEGAQPIVLADFGQNITLEVEGLSYDKETNTLTLTNFTGEMIYAEDMGPDFTIYLKGTNRLGRIFTNAFLTSNGTGSITIDGDVGASLVVNEDRRHPVGLLLAAGGSPTRLAVNWGIDVDLYGSTAAVLIADTSCLYDGIQVEEGLLLGGSIAYGEYTNHTNTFTTDWTITEGYDSLAAGKEIYIHSGRGG